MFFSIMKALLKFITSPSLWPGWKNHLWMRAVYILVIIFLLGKLFVVCVYPPFFRWYTGDKTAKVTFDSVRELSPLEFNRLAGEVEMEAIKKEVKAEAKDESDEVFRAERERLLERLPSARSQAGFAHIGYFRDAGIRKYEGPSTCLQCHSKMKVAKENGKVEEVDLMDDVINSAHFLLFGSDGKLSTYGYNGCKVNECGRKIPVGKIDRACGIPGSFSWTGWAALAEAKPKNGNPHLVSEGCGQCHIGGMYGPASDYMMPIHINDKNRKEAVDCLICHSQNYDMNNRYVVKDNVGLRWNQDRSMKAAMTVGTPTADSCLRCHQHNMGGDTYENNDAAKALGYKNPRLLHSWSKRGAPYSVQDDVHARAGVNCLDCHKAEGHKIARGTRGVDLVSNDLENEEVSCEKCHGSAPHYRNKKTRAILNGHTARLDCQTCHITKLQKNSVVLIDWVNPKFNEEEGVFTPNVQLASGDVRTTVGYLWYNGNGTFLANALGDNPSNPGTYDPLMGVMAQYNRIPGLEVKGGGVKNNSFISQLSEEMLAKRRMMIDKNLKPVQALGVSKIHPFHLFNAYMYEDMGNQGPFGAMILPFDYKTYFETGNTRQSVDVAIAHPIVKRMYQWPFKVYMMDEFMYYFGVTEGWNTDHPLSKNYKGKVEPHWMRQFGTIALNHGISEKGFSCASCHTQEKGLLNFKELGYTPERIKELENLPELDMFKGYDTGVSFSDLYGDAPTKQEEENPIKEGSN